MKLSNISLPHYTKTEEQINMISHIVGAAMGLIVLITCVAVAAYNRNIPAVVGSAIYGITMILLYTMSSIYHGLTLTLPKKVFRVLDHCTIYFLIAGTYTPIALGALFKTNSNIALTILIIEWALAVIAATLTAIDLKKYQIVSMLCYIVMGWLIIPFYPLVVSAMGISGFIYLLIGGIFYTIGAVLYGIGKRKKYMHNVFHFFVLIASFIQYLGIITYAL